MKRWSVLAMMEVVATTTTSLPSSSTAPLMLLGSHGQARYAGTSHRGGGRGRGGHHPNRGGRGGRHPHTTTNGKPHSSGVNTSHHQQNNSTYIRDGKRVTIISTADGDTTPHNTKEVYTRQNRSPFRGGGGGNRGRGGGGSPSRSATDEALLSNMFSRSGASASRPPSSSAPTPHQGNKHYSDDLDSDDVEVPELGRTSRVRGGEEAVPPHTTTHSTPSSSPSPRVGKQVSVSSSSSTTTTPKADNERIVLPKVIQRKLDAVLPGMRMWLEFTQLFCSGGDATNTTSGNGAVHHKALILEMDEEVLPTGYGGAWVTHQQSSPSNSPAPLISPSSTTSSSTPPPPMATISVRSRNVPLNVEKLLEAPLSAHLSNAARSHILTNFRKKLIPNNIWKSCSLVRASRDVRQRYRLAVTGGESSIRRIWMEYKVSPHVVFTPNDKPLPPWMVHMISVSTTPVLIFRANGADINRWLLSADFNDGFAAEFPIVMPPLDPLMLTLPPSSVAQRLNSAIVVTEARIPSNVGAIVRAAADKKFGALVLDRCCDLFSEKVIRSSGGAVFAPHLQVYEIRERDASMMEDLATPEVLKGAEENSLDVDDRTRSILQKMAIQHRLLPIAAVPSQTAPTIFQAQQQLLMSNYPELSPDYEVPKSLETGGSSTATTTSTGSNPDSPTSSSSTTSPLPHSTPYQTIGPMLMLGAESHGLDRLLAAWTNIPVTLTRRAASPGTASQSTMFNSGDASGTKVGVYDGSSSSGAENSGGSAGGVEYETVIAHPPPYQPVSLEMTNLLVPSLNLALAGSILMNHLRPAAEQDMLAIAEKGIRAPGFVALGKGHYGNDNDNDDDGDDDVAPTTAADPDNNNSSDDDAWMEMEEDEEADEVVEEGGAADVVTPSVAELPYTKSQ